VVSLHDKSNITLKINVRHNESAHHLSLSRQEEPLDPGDPWWTYTGTRLRCNRILDGEFLLARVSLHASKRGVAFRFPPDVIDNAILQTLDETPFELVHELAKSTCIPCTIVWSCLTGSFGFVVKYLHWVPHRFTDAQWQIRVDRSNELLRLLEFVQDNDWQNLMTLDESWFYL
jgi:hypothetical protein